VKDDYCNMGSGDKLVVKVNIKWSQNNLPASSKFWRVKIKLLFTL